MKKKKKEKRYFNLLFNKDQSSFLIIALPALPTFIQHQSDGFWDTYRSNHSGCCPRAIPTLVADIETPLPLDTQSPGLTPVTGTKSITLCPQ